MQPHHQRVCDAARKRAIGREEEGEGEGGEEFLRGIQPHPTIVERIRLVEYGICSIIRFFSGIL